MSNLLKTFSQKNIDIPVWFMRQAGRYLPEYMEVRNTVSDFLELCYDSKKATTVTLQPIERFNFDAAIIFSDILILPHALGWDVAFKHGEGPVLKKFEQDSDLSLLSDTFNPKVNNIYDTVSSVKAKLPKHVSLIGFAGSPWTVMSYMLEGRGKQDFSISKNFLYTRQSLALKLVKLLTEKTSEYLFGQIEAGAEIIQLFDSWSGVLGDGLYDQFVIEPTKRIVASIKNRYPDVKIIGFPRGSSFNYQKYIDITGIDGVGVDQFVPVNEMRKWQDRVVVQGNFDPVILFSDKGQITEYADRILSMMHRKNFIFNLGHGIMPQTPVENVEYLVNYVKNYNR